MKKIVLSLSALLLLIGCETGVKNQTKEIKEVPSGIVDRDESVRETSYSYQKSSNKRTSNKIFSKSAQPGYYLQVAVFQKNEPNNNFLRPLNESEFGYIVLTHYHKHYVLIGPYFSYSEAKEQIGAVNSSIGKRTFVVQVLRP